MRALELKGRVGYWLRQLTPDTNEGTIGGVLNTMVDLGKGNALCLKVMDGSTWQGAIDPSLPVNSIDDVIAIREQCHARDIGFLPVVVPRGASPIEDGKIHGAIAKSVGTLITDLEPYDGYWDKTNTSRIPEYTRVLRETSDDAYLINQPDPRSYGLTGARVYETAPHFDAFCSQHYVGWASTDWVDVDQEYYSVLQLATLNKDMYVTLYGLERIDLALAFWDRVQPIVQGACIFAFGPMNAGQLLTFGAMSRPAPSPEPLDAPVPGVDCRNIIDGLTLARTGLRDLQGIVQEQFERTIGAIGLQIAGIDAIFKKEGIE